MRLVIDKVTKPPYHAGKLREACAWSCIACAPGSIFPWAESILPIAKYPGTGMITSLNIRCVSSHGLCSLCSLFDTMIPPLDYVPGNNKKNGFW